jgi:hypothetical protein
MDISPASIRTWRASMTTTGSNKALWYGVCSSGHIAGMIDRVLHDRRNACRIYSDDRSDKS